MIVLEYRIRDTGHDADYYRREVEKILGFPVYVEVHPGLLRLRLTRKPKKAKLAEVEKRLAELCDAERIGKGEV